MVSWHFRDNTLFAWSMILFSLAKTLRLTHWGLLTHVCVIKNQSCVCQDWLMQWHAAYSLPSENDVYKMNSFCSGLNTSRPRQNGHRFGGDTFKHIFFNENFRISIEISLKIVPKGPINNIPALVQIMAWRRSGDKPLSEPMMVSLLTRHSASMT